MSQAIEKLPHGLKSVVDVAGLMTEHINYREGSAFSLVSRGLALAELHVNGNFALMYRRKNSAGAAKDRTFWVTNEDYEMWEMTHAELLEEVNRLAEMAD